LTKSAFWQQGEIQNGRVSARASDVEWSHHQTVLVPPPIMEVRLRLGFIPGDHHGRWQLEVIDPGSNELLALYSRPHFPLSALDEAMVEVGARLGVLLEDYLNPDPFP
jgi:hypothetical protein